MADKQRRVLHIDDDPIVLNLSQRILTSVGFLVDTIMDPREEKSIPYTDYDLLLLDWMLPGMNGYELGRAAREDGFPGPILILSSKDMDQEERRRIEEIEAQLMGKPFGPHYLIARVQELLAE